MILKKLENRDLVSDKSLHFINEEFHTELVPSSEE